eukprot:TRINITY_DN5900_c0_g1_i7.p1 TRINITY_DN5900_c0_g1~~TRINITY_DN5900_c0_g1_i7.p1  ORF type:complete len:752 (-),score=190.77 TRINITY_DN5900_c0_g1_i7:27-2282(-)
MGSSTRKKARLADPPHVEDALNVSIIPRPEVIPRADPSTSASPPPPSDTFMPVPPPGYLYGPGPPGYVVPHIEGTPQNPTLMPDPYANMMYHTPYIQPMPYTSYYQPSDVSSFVSSLAPPLPASQDNSSSLNKSRDRDRDRDRDRHKDTDTDRDATPKLFLSAPPGILSEELIAHAISPSQARAIQIPSKGYAFVLMSNKAEAITAKSRLTIFPAFLTVPQFSVNFTNLNSEKDKKMIEHYCPISDVLFLGTNTVDAPVVTEANWMLDQMKENIIHIFNGNGFELVKFDSQETAAATKAAMLQRFPTLTVRYCKDINNPSASAAIIAAQQALYPPPASEPTATLEEGEIVDEPPPKVKTRKGKAPAARQQEQEEMAPLMSPPSSGIYIGGLGVTYTATELWDTIMYLKQLDSSLHPTSMRLHFVKAFAFVYYATVPLSEKAVHYLRLPKPAYRPWHGNIDFSSTSDANSSLANRAIWIENVDLDVPTSHLHLACAKMGSVTSIVREGDSAIVHFASSESMLKSSKDLQGHLLGTRPLHVFIVKHDEVLLSSPLLARSSPKTPSTVLAINISQLSQITEYSVRKMLNTRLKATKLRVAEGWNALITFPTQPSTVPNLTIGSQYFLVRFSTSEQAAQARDHVLDQFPGSKVLFRQQEGRSEGIGSCCLTLRLPLTEVAVTNNDIELPMPKLTSSCSVSGTVPVLGVCTYANPEYLGKDGKQGQVVVLFCNEQHAKRAKDTATIYQGELCKSIW